MGFLRRAIEQIKPVKRPQMQLPIRRPGRPRPLPLRPRPRPMPLPMVPPPGLPITAGGLGELATITPGGLGELATIRIGTDTPSTGQKIFKSREEAEADRLGLTVEEYRAQNLRPQKIFVPRGGSVGNRPPFIQELRPPITPPLPLPPQSPTQDSGRGGFMSKIRDAIKQNPDMVRQGGGF